MNTFLHFGYETYLSVRSFVSRISAPLDHYRHHHKHNMNTSNDKIKTTKQKSCELPAQINANKHWECVSWEPFYKCGSAESISILLRFSIVDIDMMMMKTMKISCVKCCCLWTGWCWKWWRYLAGPLSCAPVAVGMWASVTSLVITP